MNARKSTRSPKIASFGNSTSTVDSSAPENISINGKKNDCVWHAIVGKQINIIIHLFGFGNTGRMVESMKTPPETVRFSPEIREADTFSHLCKYIAFR